MFNFYTFDNIVSSTYIDSFYSRTVQLQQENGQ